MKNTNLQIILGDRAVMNVLLGEKIHLNDCTFKTIQDFLEILFHLIDDFSNRLDPDIFLNGKYIDILAPFSDLMAHIYETAHLFDEYHHAWVIYG